MSVVAAILCVNSVLLAMLAVPMWFGWLPPNRFYGFRTPRTIADPRLWDPVNRVAGRDLFAAGAVSGVLHGVAALSVGEAPPDGPWLTVSLLVFVVPLLLAVLHSFYAASTLAAEIDRPHRDATGTSTGSEAQPMGHRPKDVERH